MTEDFFVGIYDPIDVRRNILEGSKEIIKSLESHDRLKQIRKEKLKQYQFMKKIMRELDALIDRLEEELPKSHIRKAIQKEKPEPVVIKKKVYNSEEEYAEQLKKLGKELKKVEKELVSLGKN